jgi:hypothetical protein
MLEKSPEAVDSPLYKPHDRHDRLARPSKF